MSITKKTQGKTNHKTKYGSRYKSKKNINKSKNNTTILCNLSYSNNIPEKDAIILSCSLFKLNDMYRDITIYINGLKKILKWIENNNHKIHLYIYYDHSIENDKLFLDLKPVLDKKTYITICKYYCETFIDKTNGMHKGVFGTFVRFYPFFNIKLLKNIKFIIDIDVEDNYLYIIENCLFNKIKLLKTKCFVLCGIGSEWLYNNLYTNKYINGLAAANFVLQNMCLPISLLNNTLIKLRDNDPKILNLVNQIIIKNKNKLNTINKSNKFYNTYTKFKDNKIFTYGIDEWWLNKIVLNYIIKKEKEIGIIYNHDKLANYFNNKIINWKLSNKINVNNFLQVILKDKYTNNFNINLKILYKICNYDNYHTINEYKQYNNLIKKIYDLIEDYNNKKLLIINDNYLNDFKKHILYKYNCFSKMNTYNTPKDKILFNYLCKNIDIPILKFNI
jgi:hypothetical protein